MRYICTLILACITLIFIGCGKGLVDDGSVLRVANSSEPEDLDPQLTTGLIEYNILQALFEGLINQDMVTLEPTPGVAERWEQSEDGLTFTFHLRKNVKWSDGTPLTADDFLFSYERILTPEFISEYAFILYYLQNAEAFHKGEITDFSQVGVKAIDAHTLELTLESPTPYFLSLLTHFSWYPVKKETILEHGKMTQRHTRWTRPGNLVSNGAYTLDKWRFGQYVSVKKNPHYWDAENTKLETIEFYPIENQNTEERAFRAGQIHVTYAVPLNKIKELIEEKSPHLRLDPELGVYYYMCNVEQPPMDNAKVRKALSLAITRQDIADKIRQRGEEAAYNMVPYGTSNYTSEPILKENIAEAQRMLAEAGYPNGEGFPELTLLYNKSETHQQIAEVVQNMWKERLGIEINLTNQEWKVYLNTRSEGDFQIARAGWFGDYNDANTFMEIFVGGSDINHSNWSNADFDALVRQAGTETDLAKREGILKQAEHILLDELPGIPVFFYKRGYLVDERVKNWPSNIMNIRQYQKMEIVAE